MYKRDRGPTCRPEVSTDGLAPSKGVALLRSLDNPVPCPTAALGALRGGEGTRASVESTGSYCGVCLRDSIRRGRCSSVIRRMNAIAAWTTFRASMEHMTSGSPAEIRRTCVRGLGQLLLGQRTLHEVWGPYGSRQRRILDWTIPGSIPCRRSTHLLNVDAGLADNLAMGNDQAISLWWIVGPIIIVFVVGLAISFAVRRHRSRPESHGIWYYLGAVDPPVGAALSSDRRQGRIHDRPIARGLGFGEHDEAGTSACRGRGRGRRRFDAPSGRSRGCHHTRPHPDI